jgi:hypothetical protein
VAEWGTMPHMLSSACSHCSQPVSCTQEPYRSSAKLSQVDPSRGEGGPWLHATQPQNGTNHILLWRADSGFSLVFAGIRHWLYSVAGDNKTIVSHPRQMWEECEGGSRVWIACAEIMSWEDTTMRDSCLCVRVATVQVVHYKIYIVFQGQQRWESTTTPST